jgi:hypothetical protein
MSSKIEAPACVKEFMNHLYPHIDLDGLNFHEGLPFYVFGKRNAITLGPHIYFREGKFDPCSCRGIALIAHELYHVHQGAGGFGFWVLRWFYIRYAWAWLTGGRKSGRAHPLEAPAYAAAGRIAECCDRVRQATGQAGPCICQDGRPTSVSEAFLSAFAAECPDPLAGDN